MESNTKNIAQHASVFNQLQSPVSQNLNLLDSLVLLILNYAAAIWGNHPSPDVDTIFSKFCRRIISVRQSTNFSAIYDELGGVPMKIDND